MSRSSRVAWACIALLSLTSASGCVKPSTNVALAGAEHRRVEHPRAKIEADEGPRPHVERMVLDVSVSGLGDMLDASEQVHAQWFPPEPGAPPLDLQSALDLALVGSGFDPTWLASVELDGLHTFTFGIPHEDQIGVSLADYELAASISSSRPAALIEGLPSNPAPQQLEPTLWQLDLEDDLRLLLRTRADTLEAATSMTLLDQLAPTRRTLTPDPRVRLRVRNFDEDALVEMRALLSKRGVDPAKQQELLEVVQFGLWVDFGRERDLTAHADFLAPLGAVGGQPLTDSSALAQLLPSGALLVMLQSWVPTGLGTLQKHIDPRELPLSSGALLPELLAQGDALLAHIGKQNALAVYVDDRGQPTLVFLTTVADEQAAKTSLRQLFATIERAFPVPSGAKTARAGKHDVDVLTLELPEHVRDALDGPPWLFGSGPLKLEIAGMIGAGSLVIAIGPGQRDLLKTLASRLAGASDAGLETGGGLARARALTDGCHTCVAIDPVAIAEGLLAILAAYPDADRALRKLLTSTRKRLLGLELHGELSIAARYDAERWQLAANVPKSLLFLAPDVAPQVRQSIAEIEDGLARTEPSVEQLCRHVIDVMKAELAGSNNIAQPSADELEKFLRECEKELAKEREKLGNTKFRKQAKCVLATRDLEAMRKCDQL